MKRKLLAVLVCIAMLTTVISPVMGTVASEFTEPTPAPVAEPTPAEEKIETPAPVSEPAEETATEAPAAEVSEELVSEVSEAPAEEPSAEPTEAVEPSEEVSEEPSVEPSEAPSEEPAVDSTEEPSVDPSEEPTEEPSVEPSEEPTEEPSVEPSEEPTIEPSVEPTEVPEELRAEIHASQRSSFAGEYVGATAEISGGTAPYSVQNALTCGDEVIFEDSVVIEEAGKVSFGAKVERTGTATMKIVVMDAVGAVVEASTVSPVASAETETKAHWEWTMKDVVLTGDWREDLIAIAISQIGYKESETNFIVREDGSVQGYTRYGDWYGMPYEEWCAMFVSFCLEYAEIPEADFPHAANCTRWIEKLKPYGAYEDAKDYEPQRGDLVFFNWDGEDDEADHVGIVEEVTEGKIFTIEGNANLQVKRREYDRSSKEILGYANMQTLIDRYEALLAKNQEEDHEEISDETDAQPETDAMVEVYDIPLGTTGKTNTDLVNVRAATSTEAEILGTISEAGTTFALTGAEMNAAGELWYKVECEGAAGYILSDFVDVLYEAQTLESTDENNSTKVSVMASAWGGDADKYLTLSAETPNLDGLTVEYIWQKSADGKNWVDLKDEIIELPDNRAAIQMKPSADTLTKYYRCVVTVNRMFKYESNTVAFMSESVVKSLANCDIEITMELIQRVRKAGGINNLYMEDDDLHFAKDGKTVAAIAPYGGKNYVIDEETGLVVAIFTEDGKIIPLVPASQAN